MGWREGSLLQPLRHHNSSLDPERWPPLVPSQNSRTDSPSTPQPIAWLTDVSLASEVMGSFLCLTRFGAPSRGGLGGAEGPRSPSCLTFLSPFALSSPLPFGSNVLQAGERVLEDTHCGCADRSGVRGRGGWWPSRVRGRGGDRAGGKEGGEKSSKVRVSTTDEEELATGW